MRGSSAAGQLWIASPMMRGFRRRLLIKRKSEMVVVLGFFYKLDMNFQSVRKGGQFGYMVAGAFGLQMRPVEG